MHALHNRRAPLSLASPLLCLRPRSPPLAAADFFWSGHGREQFPKIAEQVEAELAKYKQVGGVIWRRQWLDECAGCRRFLAHPPELVAKRVWV